MLKLNPTRRLLKTLGLGWLGFLAVGLSLRYAIPLPKVTVIIDRSYCPPPQWQKQVVIPYTDLYQQVQSNQLQITQVVMITDIDQLTLSNIPAPEALSAPFGQTPDPETIEAVQEQFSDAIFLQCETP